MSVKTLFPAAMLLGIVLFHSTGCQTATGPQLGALGYPIPVSPYFQDQQEDAYWEKERYERVPILGPLTSGGPAVALDPPTPDEVMRAMPSVEGGLPLLHERQRNNDPEQRDEEHASARRLLPSDERPDDQCRRQHLGVQTHGIG